VKAEELAVESVPLDKRPAPRVSTSVQSVARELGSTEDVDAAEIVQSLLARHAEYGAGTASRVRDALTPTSKRRHVDDWIEDVAGLTADGVETLHGRLLIVGLTRLDSELEAQLRSAGFLRLIESELREPLETLLTSSVERASAEAGDSTPFHIDEPAAFDQLGRLPFARYLAAKLRYLRQEQVGPFLVNLDGRWGSGKSSVLNILEAELRKELPPEEGPSGWTVVRFNAWQQQRFDPPWWPLIATVVRGIRGDAWRAGLRRRAARLWLGHAAWRARIGFTRHVIAGIALAALVWVSFGEVPRFEILGVSSEAVSDVGAVSALLTTGYALARSITPASQQAAEGFIRSARDPMRSLSEHFRNQVCGANAPIAVFIDDLDRCHEHYVVALIEGVQSLLRTAPVVYLVASDRRWIETSFEVSYERLSPSVTEPGRPLGHLFLQKVFQLSAGIPPIPSDIAKEYWSGLLGVEVKGLRDELDADIQKAKEGLKDLTRPEEVEATLREAESDPASYRILLPASLERMAAPDMQAKTQHALTPFISLLERNPRAMKRLVNAYDMQRAMFRLSHGPGGALSEEAGKKLVLWTILLLRWPSLAEHLQSNPDSVMWITDASSDERLLPSDPHVRALFELPEARRVVKGDEVGVSLDPNSIRAITGILEPTRLPEPSHKAPSV
jgi:hypothetical protein